MQLDSGTLDQAMKPGTTINVKHTVMAKEMTMREQIAAMAMQGMLARGPLEMKDNSVEGNCKHAVLLADALIAELEKK